MTDLTTTHLQQLLDQATPGTWDYIPSQEDPHTYDTKTSTMCINMGDSSEHPKGTNADLELATAAPQLAEEVIRMRLELSSMRHAWEDMSTNPAHTPTEQNLAAHVLVHIDSILGETND
ncbi:hypothetical protein ACLI1R_000669 [Corynebacterium sp. LaCa97]|uniref:hypothetical protein n=1 Tax=Corynebacterium sp. LaCa97 TaxID=3391431 RepID=UPI00205BD471|nr:MAG TPA: hypothetical protein [Caudoviricetes sp.]